MNHNPSDDSANVPPSGQAVVAGISLKEKLHQSIGAEATTAAAAADRTSYHLNPSLQQALGCLDINLEDELTRFRTKQEETSPTATSTTVSDAVLEPHLVTDFADGDILTAEIINTDTPRHNKTVSAVEDNTARRGGFTIVDGFSITETNGLNAITTVNYDRVPSSQELRSQNEGLDLKFSSGGEIAPFVDEYSYSSQELLRQIQSGYPATGTTAADKSTQSTVATSKRNRFTPLKIGSMAAVCVLAGGAVYTALNPNILAPLTATKIVSPTATTNSLGQLIQSPNLAANEFTELNLSTLNTIKLPTVTPTTNIATATTPTVMTATSTAPAAIPFNRLNPQLAPSATITAQPRLADSLIKSLLPPNFHSFAKHTAYHPIQPKIGR